MIYLKIRGRLGNQFFQYAAVKAYQMKYFPDEQIVLDFSDLKKLGTKKEGFKDSLCDFNVEYKKGLIDANLIQKILILIMKIPNPLLRLIGLKKYADRITYKFEKCIQPFLNKFGVFYMIHGYCNFNKTNAKNKIFYGNFESPKYFDEIKDEIKKMYTPRLPLLDSNRNMYLRIKNENSVCITIRRGDFIENDELKKVHYVCDSSFFYEAIDIIKKKVSNPTFVVFSDDIPWVKEHMNFGKKALYETGNDTLFEKMRLMSGCKNFIISNSTFSFWAQYLSKNDNKVVVAPKKWKNIAYKKDTKKLDIYEDFWIRI